MAKKLTGLALLSAARRVREEFVYAAATLIVSPNEPYDPDDVVAEVCNCRLVTAGFADERIAGECRCCGVAAKD